MLKNILNLDGTQVLSKNELKEVFGSGNRNCLNVISGGGGCVCNFPNYCVIVQSSSSCPPGSVLVPGSCY
jgi:hypothetical protein